MFDGGNRHELHRETIMLIIFLCLAGLVTLAVTYAAHAVNTDEQADEALNVPPERVRID